MGQRNLRIEEGHGAEARMTPGNARLFDEMRESSIRHYVWGREFRDNGTFTLIGIWFLLGG